MARPQPQEATSPGPAAPAESGAASRGPSLTQALSPAMPPVPERRQIMTESLPVEPEATAASGAASAAGGQDNAAGQANTSEAAGDAERAASATTAEPAASPEQDLQAASAGQALSTESPAPVGQTPPAEHPEPARQAALTEPSSAPDGQGQPAARQAAPAEPGGPPQPAMLTTNALPARNEAEKKDDENRLQKIVGQMIMVGFEGTAPGEDAPMRIAAQIETGRIGGVFFTARNLRSSDQIKALTAAFRAANEETPPFLAIVQEGGTVYGLPSASGFSAYPSPRELGLSNDPLNAYTLYQGMAAELAAHGFNMNIAPSLELRATQDPDSGDAGERGFGFDPRHVAAFAKAFKLAHLNAGVLTALKSFPGKLAAASHSGGPQADPARGAAHDPVEPYRQLIGDGDAALILIGHDPYGGGAEAEQPASLSALAIGGRLRSDLGYQGVVMTDDLDPLLSARALPPEALAVSAIEAGNDILLFANAVRPDPDLPEKVAAAVLAALVEGRLTEERLNASYERITALKKRLSGVSKAVASAHPGNEAQSSPDP